MSVKASPSVLVQVLSGILWVAAGLALAVCISARYRRVDLATVDMPDPIVATSQVTDDPVAEDSEPVAYERIKPAFPAAGGFHSASSRHGIHIPTPALRVTVTLPLEQVAVPVERSISSP
jgi:hypothetical protein